jgi:hypothetical protein
MLRRVLLCVCLLQCLGCEARDRQGEAQRQDDGGEQASPPTKAQICQHARDRFSELSRIMVVAWTQSLHPEELRTETLAGSEQIQAIHREHFVEICLRLDADGLECMTKLDTVADGIVAAQKGLLECSAPYEGDAYVMPCQRWLAAFGEALRSQGPTCQRVFDEIMKELDERVTAAELSSPDPGPRE